MTGVVQWVYDSAQPMWHWYGNGDLEPSQASCNHSVQTGTPYCSLGPPWRNETHPCRHQPVCGACVIRWWFCYKPEPPKKEERYGVHPMHPSITRGAACIRLRDDSGPSDARGPLEEFVLVEGLFYRVDQIVAACQGYRDRQLEPPSE